MFGTQVVASLAIGKTQSRIRPVFVPNSSQPRPRIVRVLSEARPVGEGFEADVVLRGKAHLEAGCIVPSFCVDAFNNINYRTLS